MKDIAVIGSGSIGLLIALELHKKLSGTRITLYGSKNIYSASYAAGAMINILSEVDCININHPLTRWKLKNHKKAIKSWIDLDQYLKTQRIINHSIMHGSGTEIIIDNDSINTIEKNSFLSILKAADEYKIKINEASDNQKKKIIIEEEKSVDSNFLLKNIYKFLSKNINCIERDIISIERSKDERLILYDSNQNFKSFDKAIIACGAWSEKLIENSFNILTPKIKSFFGIGSALSLKSELPYVTCPRLNKIVRTPNRGGTCGIHGVQRENSIYVGASSHITNIPLRLPKPTSISTLLSGAESILGLDIHELAFEIVMGYRPVTSDATPIIGALTKNLYCIYGTKRDGFTWAPFYADCLVKELNETTKEEWSSLLNLCSPYRNFISAGSIRGCIDSYLQNKKFEHFQHNRNLSDEQLKNFEKIAIKTHEFINKNKKEAIGLHPELINIIYYSNHLNVK